MIFWRKTASFPNQTLDPVFSISWSVVSLSPYVSCCVLWGYRLKNGLFEFTFYSHQYVFLHLLIVFTHSNILKSSKKSIGRESFSHTALEFLIAVFWPVTHVQFLSLFLSLLLCHLSMDFTSMIAVECSMVKFSGSDFRKHGRPPCEFTNCSICKQLFLLKRSINSLVTSLCDFLTPVSFNASQLLFD